MNVSKLSLLLITVMGGFYLFGQSANRQLQAFDLLMLFIVIVGAIGFLAVQDPLPTHGKGRMVTDVKEWIDSIDYEAEMEEIDRLIKEEGERFREEHKPTVHEVEVWIDRLE